jgi:hypothetical protein
VISALIMGSPVRRLINSITRCRAQPHNCYAGTDDGRGTGTELDMNRVMLMRVRFLRHQVRAAAPLVGCFGRFAPQAAAAHWQDICYGFEHNCRRPGRR